MRHPNPPEMAGVMAVVMLGLREGGEVERGGGEGGEPGGGEGGGWGGGAVGS